MTYPSDTKQYHRNPRKPQQRGERAARRAAAGQHQRRQQPMARQAATPWRSV
jgi:hypothetical protein